MPWGTGPRHVYSTFSLIILFFCGVLKYCSADENRTTCIAAGMQWCGDFPNKAGCQSSCYSGATSTVSITASGDWVVVKDLDNQAQTFVALSNSFYTKLFVTNNSGENSAIRTTFDDRLFLFNGILPAEAISFKLDIQGSSFANLVRIPGGYSAAYVQDIFLNDSTVTVADTTSLRLLSLIFESAQPEVWDMSTPSYRPPEVTDFFKSQILTECQLAVTTVDPCPLALSSTFAWWASFVESSVDIETSGFRVQKSGNYWPEFEVHDPLLDNKQEFDSTIYPGQLQHFYFDVPVDNRVGRMVIRVEQGEDTCPHQNYEQNNPCPFGLLLVRKATTADETQCPSLTSFDWRQSFTGLALLSLSARDDFIPGSRYYIAIYADVFSGKFDTTSQIRNTRRAVLLDSTTVNCHNQSWNYSISIKVDHEDAELGYGLLFILAVFMAPLLTIYLVISKKFADLITFEEALKIPARKEVDCCRDCCGCKLLDFMTINAQGKRVLREDDEDHTSVCQCQCKRCLRVNCKIFNFVPRREPTADDMLQSLRRSSIAWTWSTLSSLAIFAWVPAFQYTIDQMLDDNVSNTCHFNALCAMDVRFTGWFKINSFNNFLSNLGYVLCGLFFILWVRLQSTQPKLANKNGPTLYYTMGVAVMAEGLFSAVYHTCPTISAYQFDTIFMFFISGTALFAMISRRRTVFRPTHFFATFDLVVIFNMVGVYASMNGQATVFWAFMIPLWFIFFAFVTFWQYTGRGIFCCRTVHRGKPNRYIACCGVEEGKDVDPLKTWPKLLYLVIIFWTNIGVLIGLALKGEISSDVFLLICAVNWVGYLFYYLSRKLFPTGYEKVRISHRRYKSILYGSKKKGTSPDGQGPAVVTTFTALPVSEQQLHGSDMKGVLDRETRTKLEMLVVREELQEANEDSMVRPVQDLNPLELPSDNPNLVQTLSGTVVDVSQPAPALQLQQMALQQAQQLQMQTQMQAQMQQQMQTQQQQMQTMSPIQSLQLQTEQFHQLQQMQTLQQQMQTQQAFMHHQQMQTQQPQQQMQTQQPQQQMQTWPQQQMQTQQPQQQMLTQPPQQQMQTQQPQQQMQTQQPQPQPQAQPQPQQIYAVAKDGAGNEGPEEKKVLKPSAAAAAAEIEMSVPIANPSSLQPPSVPSVSSVGSIGVTVQYHQETVMFRIYPLVAAFVVIATAALYIFSIVITDKTKPLHVSRLYNQECVFLVFDWHDLWHMLGAYALLFMCLICYHIDDDIPMHARVRVF